MRPKTWALALSLVPGVGGATYKRLTHSLGSPEAVLHASRAELEDIPKIGPKVVEGILSCRWEKEVQRMLQILETQGIRYVAVEEEGYPVRLKALPSPPPILFFKGHLNSLKTSTLTIVGTRDASRYGMGMAFSISRELALSGLTIVSGMARGIDTAAHRGALETGETVAIVGSGLDSIYPLENTQLSLRIEEKGGAVISPFPPGTPPERGNFPRRNLIMAALTDGVLVVEAGEKSGALMTARYAKKLERNVFALPGPVGSRRTRGVHALIKEGAHLVEDASDVLEIMNPRNSKREAKEVKSIFMTVEERKIWDTLEEGPLPVELIMERCNLSLSEIYALLLEMELKGLVTVERGNIYERRVT